MSSYWVTSLCIALPLTGLVILFTKSQKSWQFLFKGREIMMKLAMKHGDEPFSVAIPGNRLHLFTSKQHWDELNGTSLTVLSNHAWSKDMLQPKHAFGYDWPDRRDEEGMPIVRAIRTVSNQFSGLRQSCIRILQQDLNHAITSSPKDGDRSRLLLCPTIQYSLTRITTLLLYGEDLASDPEFMRCAVKFLDEASMVAEAAKTLPSFLLPVAKKLIQGRNLNRDHVYQSVAKQVEEFRIAKTSKDTMMLPKTTLNAFMGSVPDDWSTIRVVHIVNTLWYSASHAIAVLAAHLIQDMYAHDSYIPTLLAECQGVLDDDDLDIGELPLLEAFLMESMRTKCFQSTTIHRVPLGKPYRFSDGYTVPAGEIISFLQQKVYSDESFYPDPSHFDPMRFKDSGKAATDMSGMEWAFWGNSKLACPGRFIFSNVAKLSAIYLLTKFDAHLENRANLNFAFRDAVVPSPKSILLMRARTS